MNRKLVMCLLACALVATVGMAKGEPKEKPRPSSMSGGWGFFGPYVGMFSFDNLNAQLKDTTLAFTDDYNKTQFMFGGGGMGLSDNVTIGGYGFGGKQSVHSSKLQTVLQAEYAGGMFEVGWMPVTTSHFLIGPALGIGGAGFTLHSNYTQGPTLDFGDLLRNGTRTWSITNTAFTFTPTLNILVPVSWAGIFIKAGYFLSLFDKDWNADGIELLNPPNLRSSGPFASVQIMLGGASGGAKAKVKVEKKTGDEENEEPGEKYNEPPEPPEPEQPEQ